ncbi:hypothetical protein AC792_09860 [Arthrobacter sp. RIT-PI-e]|nr:hypothetical protein AC792_09860 [Arthrobacter sp. RIT-PI-e]
MTALVAMCAIGAGPLVLAAPGLATTTPAPGSSGGTPSPAVATGAPSAGSVASGPPVVLDTQLTRILRAVATTAEEADAAADAGLLTGRIGGAAGELRAGAYALQAADDAAAALPPVTAAPVLLDLIPTSEGWPRSIVALTQGEEDPVPQALLLTQGSPRENYLLVSAIQMLPGSTFPSPPTAGATGPVALDDAGALNAAPQDAVTAIADHLTDPDDAAVQTFEDNSFTDAIIDFQAEVVADPGNDAATITFTHTAVPDRTEALLTGDGGAMVFGYLEHTYSSVPRSSGDTIDLTGTVYQELTGQDTSESGIDVNYGEAVMMYVPPAGSDATIRVVGAAQQLLSATLR